MMIKIDGELVETKKLIIRQSDRGFYCEIYIEGLEKTIYCVPGQCYAFEDIDEATN